MVQAWIADHRRQQKEQKQRARDRWSWSPKPLGDLTERDKYRFRVTSALLKAIEKAGGEVMDASIAGKLKLRVSGEEVKCVIVEKMTRPLKPPQGDAASWTAFPNHHQTGLYPTGFLRVEITTYLGEGSKRRWIETTNRKVGALLSAIVGELIAAGPVLVDLRRKREEQRRRWQQEAEQRYERQRLAKQDAERWTRFRDLAEVWDQCERVDRFLDQIRVRLVEDDQAEIAGKSLEQWLSWAEAKRTSMDPFSGSVEDLFNRVVHAPEPSRSVL
ncbi:MAG: hypothetical protein AAF563_04725 [Pseudomonadota bacterium]